MLSSSGGQNAEVALGISHGGATVAASDVSSFFSADSCILPINTRCFYTSAAQTPDRGINPARNKSPSGRQSPAGEFSLSPFNRPFSRWTWVSRCLLKQRIMEVVVTTGDISRASSSQIITANKPTPNFLQAGCPSCRPTNSVKALKGKYHILWTCLPQAHLGASKFVSNH